GNLDNLAPPFAPVCEITKFARRNWPKRRRITTGFVFTLAAIRSELTNSSPDFAKTARICTAIENWVFVDIL
ncbi:hypothetical protein OFB94_31955, partial [Escherichia coli]|nr:hypothetical protein [Escherichia coli]